MKRYIHFIITLFLVTNFCSCAPLRGPIDAWAGFSKSLKTTEIYIRNNDWGKAAASLKSARTAWKKIKPVMQIDIDHDYVNNIENNFTLLKGYIETREKPEALALILLVQEDWKNIGSM